MGCSISVADDGGEDDEVEEIVEVVEEREDGGDVEGCEALRGCGGGTVVGLGVRMGGLTTLLKFDEDKTEAEEEEVEEVVAVVEDAEEEEGRCEALLTASHIDTPLPPPCLLAFVEEVVEVP